MGEDSLREAIARPRTQGLIRSRARAVIGNWGGTPEDVDDLVQFITLFLLRLAPKYAAARAGRRTFIERGINWAIRAYLKEQRRLKRNSGRRVRSLDAPTGGAVPGGVSLSDTILEGGGGRGVGRYVPGSAHAIQAEKVRRIFEHATPLDAEVGRGLATDSVLGVATKLGISRGQVRQSMARLRALYEREET